MTTENLQKTLERQSKHIDDLINMIPSKDYVVNKHDDESDSVTNNKFHFNKKQKLEAIEITKNRKKMKLDPEVKLHTTCEIMQENNKTSSETTKTVQNSNADIVQRGGTAPSLSSVASKSLPAEVLKAKLYNKIAALRSKRERKRKEKALATSSSNSGGQKSTTLPTSDKATKRRMKKEARKEAIRKSKVKKNPQPSTSDSLPSNASNNSSASNASKAGATIVPVYSKIVFEDKNKSVKKDTTNQPSGGNLKQALQKIKAKKDKLSELEAKGDVEKVENIKKKESWKKALDKAVGIKVKDDEKLLQNSIKKREKAKKKSAEEWEKRKEETKSSLENRQKRRQENILKKKEESHSSNKKKSKKNK